MNLFINNHWFMPDPVRTGNKIREIRLKSEKTVQDFAFDLGVDIKTVYAWEKGISFPTIDHLEDIKRDYNVSFNDLLLPERLIDNFNINELMKEYNPNDLFYDISIGNSYYTIDITSGKVETIKLLEFDNNDFPILLEEINMKKDIEFLEKRRRYYLLFETLIQKKLFSYGLFGDETMFDELGFDAYIDEDEYKKFIIHAEENYGKIYRAELTEASKNYVLFDFFKIILKKCNSKNGGAWSIVPEFLETILMCYNKEFMSALVNSLPPLLIEIIYNGLLICNANDLSCIIDILESKGCQKYSFINGYVFKNNIDVNVELFKNSKKRSEQILKYREGIKFIIDKLIDMTYFEYCRIER